MESLSSCKGQIDYQAGASTRWHSTQRGFVRTSDFLGDQLAAELRAAVQSGRGGRPIIRCARSLRGKLKEYEDEPRVLVKLAYTGRVVEELQRAIETALGLLGRQTADMVTSWRRELQDERCQRVKQYEALLGDQDSLRVALGDDEQQLEVQTLLKDCVEKYGALLTPGELDVMASVFEASVDLSDTVATGIPAWFAAMKDGVHVGMSTFIRGEEQCLRETALLSELRHPNIRKFYGACHVGKKAFVLHDEIGTLAWATWSDLLGCARGLLILHDRGLVHENLTLEHLISDGSMSGLGLVPAPPLDGVFEDRPDETSWLIKGTSTPVNMQLPSKPRDVVSFGAAVFKLLVSDRCTDGTVVEGGAIATMVATIVSRWKRSLLMRFICKFFGREKASELPGTKPSFVHENEWHLLLQMCCAEPAKRPSMMDVVDEIETIVKKEHGNRHHGHTETVNGVQGFYIGSLNKTLAKVLEEAATLCDNATEDLAAVHRPVCDRLTDVYEQLLKCSPPLSLTMVDIFAGIVERFFLTLERKTSDGLSCGFSSSRSVVGSLCASRTVAGRNYGLHHDIDRFLREFSSLGLEGSSSLHDWKPAWNEVQHRQRETLKTLVEDPSPILENLEDEAERSEALTLLEYERESTGLTAVGASLSALPPWYIPPHRVQLGTFLASGAFGAVYEGIYEETPVIVKLVLSSGEPSAEMRRQFMQEADVWFSLEHRYVLKLFGACHEGRPFFVCERAMRGTIVEVSTENQRYHTKQCLFQAAEGLQHLHDNGVVHGDLKGNNILVSDNDVFDVKLADFGLSFATNNPESATAADNGALGAFRWKAPEVLRGGKATFASDIYSFGMCIIEAVTGKFPWGNSLSDEAVKYHVLERRSLPQRPEEFDDARWDLVTRMCCYEPAERLTIGAVVAILRELVSKF